MIIASHDSICLPFFIISSSAYWCRDLNSLWKFISISFYFFMKTKCKFLVEEIKIDDKCFANSCFGKFIQEKNHHRTHWRLNFRYKAKKKKKKKIWLHVSSLGFCYGPWQLYIHFEVLQPLQEPCKSFLFYNSWLSEASHKFCL